MKSKQLIRYRIFDDWKIAEFDKLVSLVESNPELTFKIKSICNHSQTHVDDGVRYCNKCKDSLEVVSYRG